MRVKWFGAALYDTSPWRTVAIQTAWLVGSAPCSGAGPRSMRRLAG